MYGEPYGDADGALALLLLSGVFTFPAWIASTTAYAAGAERRIVAIVAASLTFNVAANLLAIPAWGIEGAAAVNVATEADVRAAPLRPRARRRTTRMVRSAGQAADRDRASGNRRTGVPRRAACRSAGLRLRGVRRRAASAANVRRAGLGVPTGPRAQSRGSGRRRRRAMIGPYGFSTRAQTATVKYGISRGQLRVFELVRRQSHGRQPQ